MSITLSLVLVVLSLSPNNVHSDNAVMMNLLKKHITNFDSLEWIKSNQCNWKNLQCYKMNWVIKIQIKDMKHQGTIPKDFKT